MIKHARKFGFEITVLSSMLLMSWWPSMLMVGASTKKQDTAQILPYDLAQVLTPSILERKWPNKIVLNNDSQEKSLQEKTLNIEYTIDTGLQEKAQDLLAKYNPDYAVITAIDPETGAILAMADSTREPRNIDNLALLNSFPAASISKVITAAAILNEEKATPRTYHAFNGKVTSLYKKNVFSHRDTKYTRHFTLKESFAKSANAIFGRLGAVDLGGDTFLDYAEKFGFNHRFKTDLLFDNGLIELNTNDRWQVAESASGYTRRNTLSPLHGAVLGAIAVNNGKLVIPHLVKSIKDNTGKEIYNYRLLASPKAILKPQTSRDLNTIMQATASQGSARRAFRKFHRGELSQVKVGGKTGSLTGFEPHGKYDWFVGFGEHGQKKIAYAILCINKHKWYVKSSQLARQLVEYYYTRDDDSPKWKENDQDKWANSFAKNLTNN